MNRYIIVKNNNEYYNIGSRTPAFFTTDIERATLFKTYEKAEARIKESKLRKCGDNITIIEHKQTVDIFTDCESPKYDINDNVSDIFSFVSYLESRMSYLSSRLSILDKTITDIEHACEFYKLNVVQGYKLYKLMHENMNIRRQVKDEISKIQYIENSKLSVQSLNNLIKSIKGLDNRKYEPRVLEEIFSK